ncbi:MAG: hypothetical protein ACJAS4_001207 [Bacteriovoracaceae bacterium]|jgi:hypothetical protein
MKKTFTLKDPVKKVERVADAIKHEVKKYLKRERNKTVPDKVDFWDFDCRIGDNVGKNTKIEVSEISSNIDKFVAEEKETFYLEIIAKPGFKISKPKKDS